jgi:recombination protein RecT
MATTSLEDIKTGKANPVASFSKFLDTYKPQLALALPAHLKADRLARLVLTEFSRNPKLQECDARSIIGSMMTAATMGLEIGVSGQGYLIPYKRTCTFVPGWRGIVDLINRSGRATVWTGAVFEGDDFDYALGDRPSIKHKPGDEDDPKKITHVYACGHVNGAERTVIEVWRISKVKKHFAKMNKVGAAHYAYSHWEMYARKLPLLQIAKYMPISIELGNAIQMSNAAESGIGSGFTINADFKTIEPIDPETGEILDPTLTSTQEKQAAASKSASSDAPTAKTVEQYVASIGAASGQDAADLVLDEASDLLPAEGMAVVREAYVARFPK